MPARKTTTEEPAAEEPTQASAPDTAPACSNCGAPATQQTTNAGANVDYYCDSCAEQVYPQPWPEKHFDYEQGAPLEPISG